MGQYYMDIRICVHCVCVGHVCCVYVVCVCYVCVCVCVCVCVTSVGANIVKQEQLKQMEDTAILPGSPPKYRLPSVSALISVPSDETVLCAPPTNRLEVLRDLVITSDCHVPSQNCVVLVGEGITATITLESALLNSK